VIFVEFFGFWITVLMLFIEIRWMPSTRSEYTFCLQILANSSMNSEFLTAAAMVDKERPTSEAMQTVTCVMSFKGRPGLLD
jgi:hypothetical protein